MTVTYFLFVVFAGQMQVVGPFHGLIACEKAASQVRVVSAETNTGIRMRGTAPAAASAVCLSQKHMEFKYKEPKK